MKQPRKASAPSFASRKTSFTRIFTKLYPTDVVLVTLGGAGTKDLTNVRLGGNCTAVPYAISALDRDGAYGSAT